MPQKELRIGLVGYGFMGRTHSNGFKRANDFFDLAYRPVLKAVCGRSADKTKAFAEQWGYETTESDWKQVIARDDIDAVDICTPNDTHAEIAIAAAEAGKMILCEKPLARTAADAKAIADAAKHAKGIFMPAMCMRFWPQWRWLKEQVEKKTYGRVLSASFRRVAQMPGGWFGKGEWSGGALLDLHIHDTDFVNHLFGMPGAVTSRGYSKTTGEIDHIVTEYVYEGADAPPMVYAEGGWCLSDGFGFSMRYTVNFENATADFDFARENPLEVAAGGKKEAVKVDGVNGYIEELKYFFDCVRNGEKPTVVTGQDAVNSIRITEAEGQSVKTGKTVSL
jgi:predicted dehydrogenase